MIVCSYFQCGGVVVIKGMVAVMSRVSHKHDFTFTWQIQSQGKHLCLLQFGK